MIEYTINIFSFEGPFWSRDGKEFGYRVYKYVHLVVESNLVYKNELCAIYDAISEIEKMQGEEVNIIKCSKYDNTYNQCDLICEITIIDSNIVKQLEQIKKIFNNSATV